MNKLNRIVSVFILITLSTIGLSAHTQQRQNRVSSRQVSDILRRLAQSSDRFRNSLNTALDQSRMNETLSENDINSFYRDFENATNQFKDKFNNRGAVAADVWDVLQKASLVNDFVSRNRLTSQTRNDWASVQSNLNALASAYGLSW